ncbi:Ger(x)C family spore germination protein [Bacillus cereus group sp. WSBC 10925]|uniref:Ger(X)C family spore germination protein n=1 Tax=Bacillus paranthracis TaxID=2026186 RepID=A0A7D8D148_9BACI|nr:MULTISPECIES: Ger(x)C family spore germination protein [Bacillus cereus group]EJR09058.1 Ger(X)C family germination protein [Bacillus cereus MSX-A12]MCC2408566.1 Ger(x)C family spore germination protein [Bacillus paranthracis]MCC2520267.1 Ger(x)C family spore germination protein [Bacillus paranthracis]MDG0919001.1 Ger(x)C family spore germination protein [Bacillus paranthracis]MDG0927871.1 Ger(x)C family spore germination protein [Bacillus paranthracis]
MKLHKIKLIIMMLITSAMLSGCWNIKEVQDIYYVAALGIDFKEGKYIAYAQLLDFSNVAKLEGARPDKQPPVWIGRGEGFTITEALNQLYKDAQQRLFWGHVSTIILSERLLRQDIKDSIDFINRYREIRYNILLYATKEPIDDILKTKAFFTLSGLSTILHEPKERYKQRSYIQPKQFYQFIRDSDPMGQTAYIPSLKISTENWKEESKKAPLLRNDGAFFVRNNRLEGWLSETDLNGLRWMNEKNVRSPVWIIENDSAVVSVVIEKPKITISPIMSSKPILFNIRVEVQAGINEKIKEISDKELITKTEDIIKLEILKSFEKGIEINADIYKLGESLYRQNPRKWKEEVKTDSFYLNEHSIKNLKVKVNLVNSGKLKYQDGS